MVKIHQHLIKLHEMKMYGEQIYNYTFLNLSQQPTHPNHLPLEIIRWEDAWTPETVQKWQQR